MPQKTLKTFPSFEVAFLCKIPQGARRSLLVAYGAAHWPAPDVLPASWSADWARWDHPLTLFAFSPYFLRLPQIEMLVSVKYGIPGEVRPIMYSNAREALLFSTEVLDQPDEPDSDPVSDAPDARTAQPQKHAQDGTARASSSSLSAAPSSCGRTIMTRLSPRNTPQEFVLLSPMPPRPTREGVPMLRARPPSRAPVCPYADWGYRRRAPPWSSSESYCVTSTLSPISSSRLKI
ncbi:hypothetical protein B0H14DRAFT_3879760 [Mycena olivaceomarginata]|nr:hypothetical protein B0H14DRAFT_3879760 [Mycena olivaceomarginata]